MRLVSCLFGIVLRGSRMLVMTRAVKTFKIACICPKLVGNRESLTLNNYTNIGTLRMPMGLIVQIRRFAYKKFGDFKLFPPITSW